jgi:predicted MFS family arabinose efflux permease
MDVGFYYMSNAAGRLLGTLLSGLSYQAGGLSMTLAVAAALAAASFLIAGRLERGLLARE